MPLILVLALLQTNTHTLKTETNKINNLKQPKEQTLFCGSKFY